MTIKFNPWIKYFYNRVDHEYRFHYGLNLREKLWIPFDDIWRS